MILNKVEQETMKIIDKMLHHNGIKMIILWVYLYSTSRTCLCWTCGAWLCSPM